MENKRNSESERMQSKDDIESMDTQPEGDRRVSKAIKDEVNEVVSQICEYNINDEESETEMLKNLRNLRNLCALNGDYQVTIVSHPALRDYLRLFIFDESCKKQRSKVHLVALQILANSIVGNKNAQQVVEKHFGSELLEHWKNTSLDSNHNILLMIFYNMFIGKCTLLKEEEAFNMCVNFWKKIVDEKCEIDFAFLHIFFEHFIVYNGRTAVRLYSQSSGEDRITFLDYIATYVRSGDTPNAKLDKFLLQYISKEFKKKSDCVLRTDLKLQNKMQPREVYNMLRIIAYTTGCDSLRDAYQTDHSLFLNISSLLRCLVQASKKPDGGGLPKPMNKLEEVALTSELSTDFEDDIYFELKTLLVRSTANLLYKNKTNKKYCVDTELMPVLLECTVMDARNPLIKEWSILAIRNACKDFPPIQEIIANLQSHGMSENSNLSELNLEMGSLRIRNSK